MFSKLFKYLKLFNLFHRQLLVAAIKQATAIAYILDNFHQPCLFLVTVILLPENRYEKLVPNVSHGHYSRLGSFPKWSKKWKPLKTVATRFFIGCTYCRPTNNDKLLKG